MPAVFPKFVKPVVNSADDGFKWARDYLRTPAMQCLMETIISRLDRLTLSTAFSGVCAPSVGIHSLGAALVSGYSDDVASRLGGAFISSLDYAFAIDWSQHCRDELSLLPCPPCCVCGNIEGFLTDETQQMLNSFGPTPKFNQVVNAILGRPNSIKLESYCYVHGSPCTLITTWLHVAGTPCVPSDHPN